MHDLFIGCEKLKSLNLKRFNTSKVNDMNGMFHNCRALTSLDLRHFNTSKVENMSFMFLNCSKLKTLDLSHFNTSRVTSMNAMFLSCSQLESLNLKGFKTSKVIDMAEMFEDCSHLRSLDLSSFDVTKAFKTSISANGDVYNEHDEEHLDPEEDENPFDHYGYEKMFLRTSSKVTSPVTGYAKNQKNADLLNNAKLTGIDQAKLKFNGKA